MNYWKSVDLKSTENYFNGVIEISYNSKLKYEIDKESGVLKLDRVLYSSMRYPGNYGFLPQTYADDGDALDIFIFSQESYQPLSVCRVKPIGVLLFEDQDKRDDKVICICPDDPEYADYNDISEIPKKKLEEVKNFFENYKKLENKKTTLKEVGSQKLAFKIINEASTAYLNMEKK